MKRPDEDQRKNNHFSKSINQGFISRSRLDRSVALFIATFMTSRESQRFLEEDATFKWIKEMCEDQPMIERQLLQNSQNLIKLEVALRNYSNHIENAFTFHKECLAISKLLESQNNQLIKKLTLKQLQLSKLDLFEFSDENFHEKIELQLQTSRIIKKRLYDVATHIPQNIGQFLSIIIGPISLLLPTSEQKFTYKNSYENMKLFSNIIMIILSIILLFFNNKILDNIFNFLLIWYYCTLTIREKILKINGSNIRRWWFMHHILSVINSCILMCWSFNSPSYQEFRFSMLLYSIYLSGMSFVQFYYQKGCLYRLYALGYSTNKMDVTVDGFVSYMWKGLGFLLPFIILSNFFLLILCNQLYSMALRDSSQIDYLPLMIAIILSFMCLGNVITLIIILNRKINSSRDDITNLNITKYKMLDKLLEKSPLAKLYSSFNQNSRNNIKNDRK